MSLLLSQILLQSIRGNESLFWPQQDNLEDAEKRLKIAKFHENSENLGPLGESIDFEYDAETSG